jgi:hypothetical protein
MSTTDDRPALDEIEASDAGDAVDGEDVVVAARLITAPRGGVFEPELGDPATVRGRRIAVGDEIGALVQTGVRYRVPCVFSGVLMGLMALPGERVHKDQPLAWMIAD